MTTEMILDTAKKLAVDITSWRRDLHKIPEIGTELPQTAAYVCEKLRTFGISSKTSQNHSGIMAVIGNPTGKCIALRADMDALPIQEQTSIDYRSQNGNMHACGHDAHTAMLLGAAKILKEHEEDLNGCVKFIFESGEESGGGAKLMLDEGALKSPDVNAMISLHIDAPQNGMNTGDFIIKRGVTHASNDDFYITFAGKGGHAGRPYMTVDPIVAAVLFINQVQYIISRETNPIQPAVISFGELNTGKGATNVIPERISMSGTIRCSSPEARENILYRFEELLKSVSEATRTIYDLKFIHGEPVVIHDDHMVNLALSCAEDLFGKEHVHCFKEQAMGSEDIGWFFEKVPGVLFRILVQVPHSDGIVYPVHNPHMTIDDAPLYKGSALLASSAIAYLNNHHDCTKI